MKSKFLKRSLCLYAFAVFTCTSCTENNVGHDITAKPKLLVLSTSDSTDSAQFELLEISINGNSRSKVLDLPNVNSSVPILSPDGTKAVTVMRYSSYNNSMLLLDFQNRTSKEITSCQDCSFGEPVWSPNSSLLLFKKITKSGISTTSTIMKYALLQSSISELKIPGDPLAVSNSDDKIVFYANGIRTMNMDGKNVQLIYKKDSVQIFGLYVHNSPVREELTFYMNGLGSADASGTYVLSLDGSDIQKIHEHAFPSDWSSDGERILLEEGSGQDELYQINRNGSGLEKLTETNDVEEYFAKWSPDGKHIAFTNDFPGTRSEISVMDADGKNLKYLTPAGKMEVFLGWVQH